MNIHHIHRFAAGSACVVAALALSSLLFCSCDDFLDESPKSAISHEQAFRTTTDLLNNAVLPVYNHIGGNQDSQGLQGTGRGVFDFNSLTTDEAIMPTRGGDWYDGGFWQTLFTHNWTSGTASMKDMWEYLYQQVIRCDEGLGHIDDYVRENGAQALTTTYAAELRAIRAMYYFYLMDLFGRVPIVDKGTVLPDDASATDLQQESRSSLYRYIVSELQASLAGLPADRSNQLGENYGRMTRPVAFFLLAKLALNFEVYADDDWTDQQRPDGSIVGTTDCGKVFAPLSPFAYCIACCDSIEAYGYELEADFSQNFEPTNEDSRENIFTIPMNPTLYSNWYCYFFRSRHYSHGAVLGGASENGASATQEMLDAFGYPDADGQPTDKLDPRFAKTFYAGTVTENGTTVYEDDGTTPLVYYPRQVRLNLTGSTYEKTAGARLHKYANDPNANADGRACNNDIVLFRYADVLLMKAEALVRCGLSGNEQFNMVRTRVGLPSAEATLKNILHERMVELAWEGWRRNDMIRFGIFTHPYTDRPQLSGEQSGFTTVFPIPADIMVMHPTWRQNPGY